MRFEVLYEDYYYLLGDTVMFCRHEPKLREKLLLSSTLMVLQHFFRSYDNHLANHKSYTLQQRSLLFLYSECNYDLLLAFSNIL